MPDGTESFPADEGMIMEEAGPRAGGAGDPAEAGPSPDSTDTDDMETTIPPPQEAASAEGAETDNPAPTVSADDMETVAPPPPEAASAEDEETPADGDLFSRTEEPADPADARPEDVALIEAILFLEGGPMDVEALARASGLQRVEVAAALAALTERYAAGDSGLELTESGGGVAISARRALWDSLRDRYGRKGEARISRAAMETLAIIAYSQPVTRAEIRALRGVSPDNMIHLLVERGFIAESGRKDVPGKPVQYGTTREFLRHFGLGSIADLPKLGEGDIDRFELDGGE